MTTTILVVYPLFIEGKRSGVSHALHPEVAPTRAPHDEASAEQKESATGGPFADVPDARTIAARAAIGLGALIGALVLIGLFFTSVALASGALRWDESVNSWLADDRSDFLVRLAERFSELADTLPILGFMALVTIVLAIGRQWQAMLLVPLAMLVEISTFLAVNYAVGRPRPDVSKIGPIPGTYSFPSGHVAATFVCWFSAALLLYVYGRFGLSRVVSAVGALATVLTGWGRVYLGMHHTVDVVMGLLMGIAALTIAAKALHLRQPVEWSVSRPSGCLETLH
jgi:undecaprenyl-diphosphatase